MGWYSGVTEGIADIAFIYDAFCVTKAIIDKAITPWFYIFFNNSLISMYTSSEILTNTVKFAVLL